MTAQAIHLTTPPKPLSRQLRFPLFLAIIYCALLVVPWLLTNIVARNPHFLVRAKGNDYTYPLKPLYIDYSILRLISALDVIAAFVSLPLLSALLARAAVVFAQRRHAEQKLTVRQLFALADRKWTNPFVLFHKSELSWFLGFGGLVVAVALALPIARSTSIGYRSTTLDLSNPSGSDDIFVSRVPGPGALSAVSETNVLSSTRSRLMSTTGGIETTMWPYCQSQTGCGFSYQPYDLSHSTLSDFWSNNTDSMLATNVKAGTSTGTAPDAYALALNSNSSCSAVSADDVATGCASASFKANLTIAGYLQVDVCVPDPAGITTSPWAAIENVEESFTFTEDLYMGIQVEAFRETGPLMCDDASCFSSEEELYLHCQMGTTLGYFQLGNALTEGVPGPMLERVPDSFDVPGPSDPASTAASDAAPGPLMLTARALFGNGSWFDVIRGALSSADDSQATYTYVQLLCSLIPLQNIDFFSYSQLTFYNPCTYSDIALKEAVSTTNDSLITLAQFSIPFFSLFNSPSKAFAALEIGAFYANDLLLSQAVAADGYAGSLIYYYNGNVTLPVIPVVTKPVFIGITTLMSLQIAMVVLLLVYGFHQGTWTRTLDAFALATVGAQLARHSTALTWPDAPVDVIGVAVVAQHERERLLQQDGLVDTSVVLQPVTSPPTQQAAAADMEMEEFLPAYSANSEGGMETEENATRSVQEQEAGERLSGEDAPPYSRADVHRSGDEVSDISGNISLLGDVERGHSPATSTSPALARAQ